MTERTYRADPGSRASVKDAIARRLVDSGWRFQRGSSAPWIPPGEKIPMRDEEPVGYSLQGAAARQIELEGTARAFQRHAEEPVQ